MPSFWYRVDSPASPRQYLQADSLPDALLQLREQGIKVAAAGEERPRGSWRGGWWRRRVLIAIYRHLASALDEGLPLPQALRKLAAESRSGDTRASLLKLLVAIEEGSTLSEAMARQPGMYPAVAVGTLGAAEQAGNLQKSLRSLAQQQEEINALAAQLALPLLYPLLVGGWVLAIITFFTAFIFPKYISLFRELGMTKDEFPVPTRVLIGLSEIAPWVLWLLGLALVFFVLVLCLQRNVARGRFYLDTFWTRLPVYGSLHLYPSLARVCSSLGLMLQQGLGLGKALRFAGRAADNETVALALRCAELAVSQGRSLSEGLRESRLLPESFVFRVGAGESSGELPLVLEGLGAEYRRLALGAARFWIIIGGPVVVVAMGLFVLFVGLSVFAPLISIISQLSG